MRSPHFESVTASGDDLDGLFGSTFQGQQSPT